MNGSFDGLLSRRHGAGETLSLRLSQQKLPKPRKGTKTEKKFKDKNPNTEELRDKHRKCNTCISGLPKGGERQKEQETSEPGMPENLLKCMSDTNHRPRKLREHREHQEHQQHNAKKRIKIKQTNKTHLGIIFSNYRKVKDKF